jgi:hypothetical protein
MPGAGTLISYSGKITRTELAPIPAVLHRGNRCAVVCRSACPHHLRLWCKELLAKA